MRHSQLSLTVINLNISKKIDGFGYATACVK